MGGSFKFDTTRERSELMRKIKSQDTQPEILLRKTLYRNGIRYRINSTILPGKPDIVINKYKLIVFVDGEFWHGYKWKEKKPKIKANREYWIKKIEGNMCRDKVNTRKLIDNGYTVLRFWEHEIKKDVDSCIQIILTHLSKEK